MFKKLSKFVSRKIREYETCPQCKHTDPQGVVDCPCTSDRCACNPAAWNKD